MRSLAVFAALAASFTLSACGGGSQQLSGPPDWFLRDQERQQVAAARASAEGMMFVVPTSQPASTYRERMAFLIQECWIAGQQNWRLVRGRSGRDLTLIEAPRQGEGAVAVRFTVAKGEAPGLVVHASGALAGDKHRARLQRALERATTFNPAAPHCPSVAEESPSASPIQGAV